MFQYLIKFSVDSALYRVLGSGEFFSLLALGRLGFALWMPNVGNEALRYKIRARLRCSALTLHHARFYYAFQFLDKLLCSVANGITSLVR